MGYACGGLQFDEFSEKYFLTFGSAYHDTADNTGSGFGSGDDYYTDDTDDENADVYYKKTCDKKDEPDTGKISQMQYT